MDRPNNKVLALIMVGVVLVGTGCISYPEVEDSPADEESSRTATLEQTSVKTDRTEKTTTGPPEGDIRAYLVTDVPDEATVVNATDDRIDDVRPIQQALDRALANEHNSSSMHIKGENFTEANQALQKLDGYTGTDAPMGYYIHKDGHVFAVFIAVYE